jgi:non-homologous end joining protein Ku
MVDLSRVFKWIRVSKKRDTLYGKRIPRAVQAMLDEKSKGREITVAAPEAPRHGQIIDLMQALKQSIEKARPKQKAAPAQRKRKTASSDS